MGKMTGVDLAIDLSRARPEGKVILFSGQTATADVMAEASRKSHDFACLPSLSTRRSCWKRSTAAAEEDPLWTILQKWTINSPVVDRRNEWQALLTLLPAMRLRKSST